jgi:transcriptional regulator of acetoin/glycerol metabolism
MSSPDTEDTALRALDTPHLEAPVGARIQVRDGDHDLLAALERGLRGEGYAFTIIDSGAAAGDVIVEVRPAVSRQAPRAEEAALVRLDDVIRRHVLQVFHATRDNVTRTAMALGISRVALRRRLREYGAKPPA